MQRENGCRYRTQEMPTQCFPAESRQFCSSGVRHAPKGRQVTREVECVVRTPYSVRPYLGFKAKKQECVNVLRIAEGVDGGSANDGPASRDGGSQG